MSGVRRAIEARDFRRWRGLPAGVSGGEVFDGFPGDLSERPTRPLGDEFIPATFVLLDLPGWYRPMASLRDGRLVMFDGRTPDLAGGWEALADDLGEPAARLDWEFGTLPIAAGEWAYPERGITAFLNTDADRALHLAVYQPTSLGEYRRALRPHLGKRPIPIPTSELL